MKTYKRPQILMESLEPDTAIASGGYYECPVCDETSGKTPNYSKNLSTLGYESSKIYADDTYYYYCY